MIAAIGLEGGQIEYDTIIRFMFENFLMFAHPLQLLSQGARLSAFGRRTDCGGSGDVWSGGLPISGTPRMTRLLLSHR